jgi:aquaporin Z
MSRGVRVLVAEAVGTMILILGGPGTAIFGNYLGYDIGTLGVSLAFGLSLLCAAYMIGSISGCHINPAVTVGLWALKKTETNLVLYYIVGQIIGALVGAGLIALIITTGDLEGPKGVSVSRQTLFTGASNGYGSHSPTGFALTSVIITEIVMTAIFVAVIASTSRKSMPIGFTGLAVGLMLALVHMISIPIDNTSVNPVRSLATAIYADSWALKQLWVFIIFPLVGGLIAAGIWMVLVDADDA